MKVRMSKRHYMCRIVLFIGVLMTLNGCVDKESLKANSVSASDEQNAQNSDMEPNDATKGNVQDENGALENYSWNVSSSTLGLSLSISDAMHNSGLATIDVTSVGKKAAIENAKIDSKTLAIVEGAIDDMSGT